MKRVQQAFLLARQQYGADALIVKDAANVRYLSAFTGEGVLVITQNQARIFTDGRFLQEAKNCTGFDMHVMAGGLVTEISEWALKTSVKQVAVEGQSFSATEYLDLKMALSGRSQVCATRGLIEGLRLIKDPHEICLLEQANALTALVFEDIIQGLKPGVTESQVADELFRCMRARGAQESAFAAIVASGPNGASPHAVPTQRQLQKGDLVTLDFGCVLDGYCSDITRTVAIGKPSQELCDMYAAVQKAQACARQALQAGVMGSQVHKAAVDELEGFGLAAYFVHGLGHGIGLQVHEAPRLSKTAADTLLAPNMVVTVEPGVYVPGVGGVRIEDVCVVRQLGNRNITPVAHELMVL